MSEISNEAKELASKVTEPYGFYNCNFEAALRDAENLIQSALNTARNNAFEDAAKMVSACGYNQIANGIRAMVVQP